LGKEYAQSDRREEEERVSREEKKKEEGKKKLLTFAFYSPIFAPGRGNGKRVAAAPLPSGSPEPRATR
jgi:hypothetical protein